MAAHNDLGKKGEDFVVKYLWANGYEILETNYRFDKAEVDIIAKKDGIIVVIEVKTRSTKRFGNPYDSITPKKEALLSLAIEHYLEEKNIDLPVRADVIFVYLEKGKVPNIEHIKDAFSA